MDSVIDVVPADASLEFAFVSTDEESSITVQLGTDTIVVKNTEPYG